MAGLLAIISLVISCSYLQVTATTFFPATAPQYEYIGRVNITDEGAQFDWSGVQISFGFSGTTLKLAFQTVLPELVEHGLLSARLTVEELRERILEAGQANMYNVFIDNDPVPYVLNTTLTQTNYLVTSNLTNDYHSVLVTKRTEALFGIVTFQGSSSDGTLMFKKEVHEKRGWPYQQSTRSLEFIGDSITCGFGNLGVPGCDFSAETENNWLAYGPVIARNLSAEYYLEAWSGKGVVRNYGDPNITSKVPFPKYYPHTLANDFSTVWDFATYIPDGVVINLGTNDFSTQPFPPQDIFQKGYRNLVSFVQSKYPNAAIFLVCGPMIGNPCCDYVEEVVTDLNDQGQRVYFIDMQGILQESDDFGCDGHPSVKGHQIMAETAIPFIQKILDW
eukprot:TRINITY_DN2075_c0_g2_i1.p1 TRINITY_DN2075_c0_g2~~TRINITY_DN2075_c0_g2_i1.p1  ORF type:complete len:391 (+),score=52.78 TRINITY_DN2075_c0_g2_i1:51-1223(+)